MNKQTQQAVEERFHALRHQYDNAQWKSADFLNEEVDRLVHIDLPLAYRLMQRVKNIDPSPESKHQLAMLWKHLQEKHPELMGWRSTSGSKVGKLKSKANGILGAVAQGASNTNFQSLTSSLVMFVGVPFLVFALYQTLIASERFESRAQMILKQPDSMATLDPAMAFMSGIGGIQANTDNELLEAYIFSMDMITHVEQELKISEHFTDEKYDYFSRLERDFTQEDFHSYFGSKVTVEINSVSGVISILAQGFEPDFAQTLNNVIVKRAEWYINEIGRSLAKEQLAFVEQEHGLAEQRLQNAKSVLLAFQRQYDLLDPEAEGMALQQITYGLETQIASKTAELRALLSSMSENAPAVLMVQSELDSLRQELIIQRDRLSQNSNDVGEKESVGQILAKFADLQINLELALQGYTSSQVSLEKSRIEAYRQLKYLVVVETPTLPEASTYPDIFYNLSLFLVVALMLFLIVRIVLATFRELR